LPIQLRASLEISLIVGLILNASLVVRLGRQLKRVAELSDMREDCDFIKQ